MMEQKVRTELKTELMLSPQLQQNLKILQLPKLELIDSIQQELLKNPVLEEEPASEPAPPSAQPMTMPQAEDINWDQFFDNKQSIYSPTSISLEEKPGMENLPDKQASLTDFLHQQLGMTQLSEIERAIAEVIIDGIDERGYLTTPLEVIKETVETDLAMVENVLSKIQEFEPPGVGARDIKECLLLQIKDLELNEPLLKELIKNYLLQLQSKEYGLLTKKLKVSLEEIKRLVGLLLRLEPIPVRLYERLEAQYISPDIITTEEGSKIEINNDWVPQVKINPYYQKLLKQEGLLPADREFIQERLKNGLAFIKSLEERKSTLQKVAEVIFRRQKGFLDKGINGLMPMKLEDIAKELNYHETTISRTVAYKYAKTPYGTFPLKFFFSTGIANQNGEAVSSSAIKQRIKELIAKEDGKSPLSDDKITRLLKSQGFTISRRTVVNYRESLGLLSSTFRRCR